MLKLVAISNQDTKKQYEALSQLPSANGFENKYFQCRYSDYIKEYLPTLLDESKGINLKDGYVPQTMFFLYDEDIIVGVFKVRHYLNSLLKTGAGHIGYSILPQYRQRGYATKGLALAIKEADKLMPANEKEIYMSCYRYNIASYKAQLNNGAYLHHQDEHENYTRVLRNKDVVKMFVMDMDGTTLRNDKTISERTMAALNKASKKGKIIVLASGRPVFNLLSSYPDISCDYIISCNGAMISDCREHIMFQQTLPYPVTSELIKLVDSFDCYTYCNGLHRHYYSNKCLDRANQLFHRNEPKEASGDNLAQFVFDNKMDCLKVGMVGFDEITKDLIMAHSKEFPQASFVITANNCIEIGPYGVSKGHSLRQLATTLDISCEEIVVIGDNDNDESMLSYTNNSYAMENGSVIAKSIAKYQTNSNENDGVAEVLEKYL